MSGTYNTNEQAVLTARARISELKQKYMECLRSLHQSDADPEVKLKHLLSCQEAGNGYFNYVETFVGDSGLLGAHHNGKWVTGFAEDCFSVLDTLIFHFRFLRSYAEEFTAIRQCIEPSSVAYANMQRMVVEYLPEEKASELRHKFVDSKLPTVGFDVKAVESTTRVPQWQIITGLAFGIIMVVVSIVIAIAIPEPTMYQQFVLRGAFAIAIAAITPIITGFMNVTAKINTKGTYFKVVAGGALAMFVLLWVVNPPKL